MMNLGCFSVLIIHFRAPLDDADRSEKHPRNLDAVYPAVAFPSCNNEFFTCVPVELPVLFFCGLLRKWPFTHTVLSSDSTDFCFFFGLYKDVDDLAPGRFPSSLDELGFQRAKAVLAFHVSGFCGAVSSDCKELVVLNSNGTVGEIVPSAAASLLKSLE